MNINTNNCNIHFGIKLNGSEYLEYSFCQNCNGKNPDKFILSRLETYPEKHQIIFDLGAGQGRNTIPIAKKGHKIYAYEINNEGIRCIKDKAMLKKVEDRIEIIKTNILDDIDIGKKADFVFMSHVSQHFNLDNFRQFFHNVAANIKSGGELVFDALVREKEYAKKSDIDPNLLPSSAISKMERSGNANFEKNDIIQAAQQAGFKLVLESPFHEKGLCRAWYEKSNSWGGGNILLNFIEFLAGSDRKKPVKLTWFVFKK